MSNAEIATVNKIWTNTVFLKIKSAINNTSKYTNYWQRLFTHKLSNVCYHDNTRTTNYNL